MFYTSLILLFITLAVWLFTRSSDDSDIQRGGRKFSWAILAVSLIFGMFSFVRSVPAGHAGVKTFFGSVDPRPISSGLHLVNPLTHVVSIPIRTMEYTMVARSSEGAESGDDSVPLLTKDSMRINADVTVIYRVNPASASWLYRHIGDSEDFERKVVRPSSRAAFRQAALKYTMLEQLGEKRGEFEDELKSLIVATIKNITSQTLERNENETFVVEEIGEPFVIQEVLVRNIEPPARFKDAVEAKLVAEQDAQKMKFVLAKERQEAERKAVEAEGIRRFQSIVRKGIDEQLLRWKGIEATVQLAQSNNTKIVVIGQGKDGLPLILNGSEK